jgi:hypothetical protein
MSDTITKWDEMKNFNSSPFEKQINELKIEIAKKDLMIKELSKNKSENNNERLKKIIDESFELLNNCNYLPKHERLELRIKLIQALK